MLLITALSLLIVSCGPKKAEKVPEEAKEVTVVDQTREDKDNKADDAAQGTTDDTARDPAAEEQKVKAEPAEAPEIILEEEADAEKDVKKDPLPDSAVYDSEEKADEAGPSGSGQEAGPGNILPDEGEIVVPSAGRK